jgi:hypothetical protein
MSRMERGEERRLKRREGRASSTAEQIPENQKCVDMIAEVNAS